MEETNISYKIKLNTLVMKKTLLALAVLLLAANIIKAQDIQIDGKIFQTVKKTILNADIEYYRVKEKSSSQVQSQSYIKRGKDFTKTVFSELELKKFISTGKISSLGIIKEKQVNEKQKITYIIKSGVTVLLKKEKSRIKILELHDKVFADYLLGIRTAAKTGDNGVDDDDIIVHRDRGCVKGCFDDFWGSEDGSNGGCLSETVEQARECERQLQGCYDACPMESGLSGKPGNSLHLYAITLKGIAILMK